MENASFAILKHKNGSPEDDLSTGTWELGAVDFFIEFLVVVIRIAGFFYLRVIR
jgi:hypothetical protein